VSTAGGQTIGLCMIVRNEEAIVGRCLDSVAGLIDSWVICDTGSTDATPELVHAALADLPGELHETEWVDFGHNRSELMALARGSADYLLLLDADMTINVRAPLPPLSEDAYLLRETGGLDFGVLRLVRGDRHWWFEGSTHEHIATDGRFDQEQLDQLLVEHHSDGFSRDEKLIRDIGLLKRDLVRDPENARAVFYLAQTYRELGKPELAIAQYRRRVELGGWEEEVFYANLQEGMLRAEDDLETAGPVLLEAWERRPSRAEPLYALARAHSRAGDFAVAHMFASRGLEIPYPSDVLFIHRWVYEWGLRMEHAVAAAGIGRRDEARADLRRLLDTPDLPRDVAEHARKGLRRLDDGGAARAGRGSEVPRLAAIAPGTRIGEVKLDVKPAWPSFNPSIAEDGDGFRMIVRTANYAIERGVLHEEGILQNINYMLGLDGDLAVRQIEPIVDRSVGVRRYRSRIQGYEDCRLIAAEGGWYATATVCELNAVERREIALLAFDGSEIASVRRLEGPVPGRHEKNWMPLLVDGALHLLYSCAPTRLLRCSPAVGEIETVAGSEGPMVARDFRGGSQGVPLDDGWLFAVHEVDPAGRALRYLHRFVLLDARFELAAVSAPFTFTSDRVEFCAGMARRGDELVLSFGVSDAAAGLAVLPVEEALASLSPV
jgi:predicted GH43/DUF377 family glycosyl hydrolase